MHGGCLRPKFGNFHGKGQKLKDVLSGFPKDQCLDLDVEWSDYKRWPYRLVVRWNEKKQKWAFIVTNLDRAEFTLSEVLQAYRLRWQIELIFKEIKSRCLSTKLSPHLTQLASVDQCPTCLDSTRLHG